jgi:hypothetical protein
MGKIYVGQTAIEFEVDVATDVTGATCSVKYKKPSGEEASWPAVITDAANGIFVGEPASADDLAQAANPSRAHIFLGLFFWGWGKIFLILSFIFSKYLSIGSRKAEIVA